MGDPCLGGVGSLGADPCGTFGHTGGQRRSVGNLGTLGVSAAETAHLLLSHAGVQCVEGVGTRGCLGLTRCGWE